MDSPSSRIHLDGLLSPSAAFRRTVSSSSGDGSNSHKAADIGYSPFDKTDTPLQSPSAHSATKGASTWTQRSPATAAYRASAARGTIASSPPGPLITYDSSKATEGQASMQLLNAVMGAGIVGYPFCFKSCGVALGFVLVLITCLAAEFSMQLLLLAAHLAGKRSYEEVARYSFGSTGLGIVNTCIAVMNLGSLVAYLNLVTDTFSLVAGTIVPPGAEPSRNAILTGITLCAALPIALFVRSPRVLSSVSQASVAFLLLFAGVLLSLGIGQNATPLSGIEWWKWDGVLTAFPVIAYSFTAHQVLFAVYLGMRSPTVKKMTGVVTRTMGAAATVYVAVGLAGYKAFGHRTHGDVLRNLGGGGAGASFQRLIKVGYGMSLLATVPLLILPLQSTFAPMVTSLLRTSLGDDPAGKQIDKELTNSLVTAVVLATACTTAILLPNVEYVFGLAGSTASVLISFVVPAALFLQVSGSQRGQQGHSVDLARGSPKWVQRRRAAALVLIFGLIAGVSCTSALLTSIQEEAEVVQLAQEIAREEKKAAEAVGIKEEAASVAQAVEVVDEARRALNATKEGVDAALVKVEKVASKAAAAAEGGGRAADRGGSKAQATAKDLKPAVKAAVDIVAQLENAASALDAALKKRAEEAAKKKEGKTSTVAKQQQQQQGDEAAGHEAEGDSSLAALRDAGLEAVTAAKEIRKSLKKAQDALRADEQDAVAIEEALNKVITAATAASKQIDETMQALQKAAAEQQEEAAGIVAKIGEQRKEVTAAAVGVDCPDGKDCGGSSSGTQSERSVDTKQNGGTEEERKAAGSATGAKESGSAAEKQKVEKAEKLEAELKVAAELEEDVQAGREVNATKLAQAAADVAEDVVQTAKEAAEQAVGKAKKVDVAVRAIEIAKELTAGAGAAGAGGAKSGQQQQQQQQQQQTRSEGKRASGGDGELHAERDDAGKKETLQGTTEIEDFEDYSWDEAPESSLKILGNLTAVAVEAAKTAEEEAEQNDSSAENSSSGGEGAVRKGSRKMDLAGSG